MFKVIASDLDGTLLNSDKDISDYTIKTLKEAYDKGTEFIVCTGRMYDSMSYLLPKLTFSRYSITSMGAEIYDNFTKKRVYERPMEEEHVLRIAEYGLKNNVHMNIYINNVLYTNSLDKYSERYYKDTTSQALLIEGDVLEFLKGKKLSKLIFIGEEEDMPKHFKVMTELLGGKINICASFKHYLEFSHIEAQKDITLNKFIETLGYKKDELIVFGDSGNDVSMLKNTGFSVCVANGWQEAKDASNLICESNDNDGVAKTVKRFILGE